MTTNLFGGAILVNGPVPSPPEFNLLTVARPFDSPDVGENVPERWAMGMAVWPYSPDLPSGHDPCADGTFAIKGSGSTSAVPKFASFTAYLAEHCSTLGTAWDIEGYADRAVAAFAGVEYYALEKQLMSGSYNASAPWICDLSVTYPTASATAISAEAALEFLEDAIGGTGRRGVIHATPSTVIAWARDWLVFKQGNQLVTTNGTPVVSGAGYIGAHPVAQPADAATSRKSWAFATGPIVYQRGSEIIQLPRTPAEAIDRSYNTVTYRAERDYIVGWDQQLQAAVHIDRSL